MPDHLLRLSRDDFDANAALDTALPPAIRAVYVADGMVSIRAGGGTATLSANSALFHTGPMSIAAGGQGACLLRYELDPGEGLPAGAGVRWEPKLEATLRLDDPEGYLLRCDKVELPPGGIAYTHTHQGGGIRCLLKGGFNVQVRGETSALGEYDAWFEAGPDPVYAWAPDDAPGHFSRVMILPRRLKGKSSIRYVDPADADKPKLQRYTVFVDEFIET